MFDYNIRNIILVLGISTKNWESRVKSQESRKKGAG